MTAASTDQACCCCRSAGTGRYSRLQADIRAMQHNSSTYCDEPEDTEAFQAWLAVRSALVCCCEVSASAAAGWQHISSTHLDKPGDMVVFQAWLAVRSGADLPATRWQRGFAQHHAGSTSRPRTATSSRTLRALGPGGRLAAGTLHGYAVCKPLAGTDQAAGPEPVSLTPDLTSY